jgi:hypothetical protein
MYQEDESTQNQEDESTQNQKDECKKCKSGNYYTWEDHAKGFHNETN